MASEAEEEEEEEEEGDELGWTAKLAEPNSPTLCSLPPTDTHEHSLTTRYMYYA